MTEKIPPEEKKILEYIRKYLRKYYPDVPHIKIPFNIDFIIRHEINQSKKNIEHKLSRLEIFNTVDKYVKMLVVTLYGDKFPTVNKQIQEKTLMETKIIIYDKLSSKKMHELGLTRETLVRIFDRITFSLRRGIVEPGDTKGVDDGTEFGRQCTQMALDSFHFIGHKSSEAVEDFSRLKSLLHASPWNTSKKNKFILTRIYVDSDKSGDKKIVENISQYFNQVVVRNLIDKFSILVDSEFFISGKTVIPADMKYAKYYFDNIYKGKLQNHVLCIRLKFNVKKMIKENIKLSDIEFKLHRVLYNTEYHIVALSESVLRIFFIVNVGIEKVTEYSKNILHTMIKGIENIQGSVVIKGKYKKILQTGAIKFVDEYFISALGTNLPEIFKIQGIDKTRTYTNDIWSMYNMFGIEITRSIIYRAIDSVFRNNNISGLQPSHLAHVVNMICRCGYPSTSSSQGMRTFKDTGPIQSMSHERLEKMLQYHVLQGSVDDMTSPSSGLLYGQPGVFGTNIVDVFLPSEL